MCITKWWPNLLADMISHSLTSPWTFWFGRIVGPVLELPTSFWVFRLFLQILSFVKTLHRLVQICSFLPKQLHPVDSRTLYSMEMILIFTTGTTCITGRTIIVMFWIHFIYSCGLLMYFFSNITPSLFRQASLTSYPKQNIISLIKRCRDGNNSEFITSCFIFALRLQNYENLGSAGLLQLKSHHKIETNKCLNCVGCPRGKKADLQVKQIYRRQKFNHFYLNLFCQNTDFPNLS